MASQTASRGSPPHAGTGPCRSRRGGPAVGITPARGDGTYTGRGWRERQGDHPRTRGRDAGGGDADPTAVGSPPHAGTGRHGLARRLAELGITPARGDGTGQPGRQARTWTDHPRTRGRDKRSTLLRSPAWGSPPHAGTGRHADAAHEPGGRITPARGDGTNSGRHTTDSRWDHPRTRGRDELERRTNEGEKGSPPHAGTGLRHAVDEDRVLGITPARGDGTPSGPRRTHRSRDHPRTRGRDSRVEYVIGHDGGSPPHAGTGLRAVLGEHRRGRITPARGDGTVLLECSEVACRDHPRTRGRDFGDRITALILNGSPPHAGTGPLLTWDSSNGCATIRSVVTAVPDRSAVDDRWRSTNPAVTPHQPRRPRRADA